MTDFLSLHYRPARFRGGIFCENAISKGLKRRARHALIPLLAFAIRSSAQIPVANASGNRHWMGHLLCCLRCRPVPRRTGIEAGPSNHFWRPYYAR